MWPRVSPLLFIASSAWMGGCATVAPKKADPGPNLVVCLSDGPKGLLHCSNFDKSISFSMTWEKAENYVCMDRMNFESLLFFVHSRTAEVDPD